MKKILRFPGGVLLTVAVLMVFAPGIVATGQTGDVQEIEAEMGPFSYPAITVEADKPVRVNFKVADAELNVCNDEIIIPEWDISKKLSVGDNFVEFTLTETGTFGYSCWMGMIPGRGYCGRQCV